MLIRLRDVPQLPRRRFRYDNGCQYLRVATPCHLDTATGYMLVDRYYHLTGWCDSPPKELMHNREGQIALMFFSAEDGDVWQHYPLFDKDDRDAAILDCKEVPMISAKSAPSP